MTPAPQIEKYKDSLKLFDDIHSYNDSLHETMKRASEIIEMCKTKLSDAEKKALKIEIPIVVRNLRLLLNTQLDPNGAVSVLDRSDGSYDNAVLDTRLQQLLAKLRNLDTDMHRLIGTKNIRKISATINEDLPNWFGIKWREAKDNLKQLMKTTAVVGGLTAAGLLGGYALYNGGLIVGAGILGKHLGQVGAFLASTGGAAAGGIAELRKRFG